MELDEKFSENLEKLNGNVEDLIAYFDSVKENREIRENFFLFTDDLSSNFESFNLYLKNIQQNSFETVEKLDNIIGNFDSIALNDTTDTEIQQGFNFNLETQSFIENFESIVDKLSSINIEPSLNIENFLNGIKEALNTIISDSIISVDYSSIVGNIENIKNELSSIPETKTVEVDLNLNSIKNQLDSFKESLMSINTTIETILPNELVDISKMEDLSDRIDNATQTSIMEYTPVIENIIPDIQIEQPEIIMNVPYIKETEDETEKTKQINEILIKSITSLKDGVDMLNENVSNLSGTLSNNQIQQIDVVELGSNAISSIETSPVQKIDINESILNALNSLILINNKIHKQLMFNSTNKKDEY
jgi:hypothetical protein